MSIGIVEVSVDNQMRAVAFCTGVLGLTLKAHGQYGAADRWISVVSAEDVDGTEVHLAPINAAAAALRQWRRETGSPAESFATDDLWRDYQQLRARGVDFVMESTGGLHGTDVVFEDGCGTPLNLHADA